MISTRHAVSWCGSQGSTRAPHCQPLIRLSCRKKRLIDGNGLWTVRWKWACFQEDPVPLEQCWGSTSQTKAPAETPGSALGWGASLWCFLQCSSDIRPSHPYQKTSLVWAQYHIFHQWESNAMFIVHLPLILHEEWHEAIECWVWKHDRKISLKY